MNFIIVAPLLSQEPEYKCGDPVTCSESFTYPFQFCVYQGEGEDPAYCLTIECRKDISNLPYGYRLYSVPFPMCPNTLDSTIPISVDMPQNNPIFDQTLAVQEINESFKRWSCVCGKENDSCQYYLPVKFSEDASLFGDKTAARSLQRVSLRYCEIAEEGPVIIINNSDDFTGRRTGSEGRFFINDAYINEATLAKVNSIGGEVISLIDVVTHEIGHIYGLHHPSGNSPGSPNGCPDVSWNCTDTEPSIMKGAIGIATEKSTGLTDYDKCYFAKIYCNSIINGVEYLDIDFTKTRSFPNPTSAKFTIEFEVNKTIDLVSIYIVNINGQILKTIIQNKEFYQGKNSVMADISDFASGSYICYIRIGGIVQSHKVIIAR